MQLNELNVGDKFSIEQNYESKFLSGNYVKINPNTDNFSIIHLNEYYDMSNYSYELLLIL